MTSIMYPFTKFVPSESNPNNSRPKDIIEVICLFDSCRDEETKHFKDCIVVAYRESWVDYPANSTQYQSFKIGNRLMNRRKFHYNYYVNKVDDSIVIVDCRMVATMGVSTSQFYGWLKHYWYEQVF